MHSYYIFGCGKAKHLWIIRNLQRFVSSMLERLTVIAALWAGFLVTTIFSNLFYEAFILSSHVHIQKHTNATQNMFFLNKCGIQFYFDDKWYLSSEKCL